MRRFTYSTGYNAEFIIREFEVGFRVALAETMEAIGFGTLFNLIEK